MNDTTTPDHLNPVWLREQARTHRTIAHGARCLELSVKEANRASAFDELADRIERAEPVVRVFGGPVDGGMGQTLTGNEALIALCRRAANPTGSPPSRGQAHPLGSALNPSAHDCLPKLAADEPYFVIRADDPLAPAMVELHAYVGAGNRTAAARVLADIMERVEAADPPRPAGSAKYRETFHISAAMEAWRQGQRQS